MSSFDIMVPLLDMIVEVIKFLCKLLGIAILPFFVMIFFFMGFYYLRGKRRKPIPVGRRKKRFSIFSVIKRLLWDFPKRFILDWYNFDPFEFLEYGIHVVAGEQGSGKTMLVVEMLMRLKARYPECEILTNIEYKHQDGKLISSDDFVMRNNGTKGTIIFLDEIQNWFSSLESGSFPVENLQDISQQRKQRKMIIGTSQVFTRVSKPIREQTTFLYLPFTVAGCITFVRVYKPRFDNDGVVKKRSLRKLYFFVHTDELRNAYDTWDRVERLTRGGYKESVKLDIDFSGVKFDIGDF
jgi:ATP-dependent Clp protease ATP-binding subunit ClpX